ncbi:MULTISPECIES: serpin family protein [unclassified Arthrobacter]|uniref:serpin family protein n=1 Tax=unclassified Arthrobacter TaxID=235627 RepID=UPI0014932064|nr:MULTISPECIES: serpin family protein [unclassified Arthrobacter]MBE0009409.1 serpin family protein [Arthrobacter sp. AET 35A]NOJ63244.1 serpin family protein [Arthrobacter sp. 147(2020)]
MVRVRRIVAVAWLSAATMALTGCTPTAPDLLSADEVDRAAVQVGDYPEAVASLRDSSFRLGAVMLAGADPTDNAVTSPVSALYALSMLRAGAATTTAAEMDEVLGFPAENRDEAMNALLALWQEHDGDPGTVDEDDPPEAPLLHLANGIFIDRGLTVGETFLQTLAAQYGSGVYPVDFSDRSTEDTINAWISEHTGGRIDQAPLDYDPDTRVSLLNTVYFAAAWATPFDPVDTAPGPFQLADGGTIQADMMRQLGSANYASGDGWTAVDLPYNEGFQMRLILPDQGGSPVMSASQLADVRVGMESGSAVDVGLVLPKFDHRYHQDLLELLANMGLTETFGLDPDFSPINPALFVSGAAQDANITVAERGTIAAAVTQINMVESGMPTPDVDFVLDRPFQYQIIHTETGMPLFMGTVTDPR